MNPLALCFTLSMFSAVVSEEAISRNAELFLAVTTQLYIATRDDFDKMKTDDCWRDCALQTINAFRRLRSVSKRSVNSRVYAAIDRVRKAPPEGTTHPHQFPLTSGFNKPDMEEEGVVDENEEIFDPTIYA